MTSKAFETIITGTCAGLVGPWRRPHQLLHAQVYDSHASIHDDATALASIKESYANYVAEE